MLGLNGAEPAEEQPIEVLRDMLPAIELFAVCSGQWRWHPVTGEPIDLDFVALDRAAAWLGIQASSRLFDDVRALAAGWREEVASWR